MVVKYKASVSRNMRIKCEAKLKKSFQRIRGLVPTYLLNGLFERSVLRNI